jgi:hypothetical protein
VFTTVSDAPKPLASFAIVARATAAEWRRSEARRPERKDFFVCPADSRTNKNHQSFGQVFQIPTEDLYSETYSNDSRSHWRLSSKDLNITKKTRILFLFKDRLKYIWEALTEKMAR